MAEAASDPRPLTPDAGPAAPDFRAGDDVAVAASAPGLAAEPEHVDVWSRTEPKYRIRAITLLVTNFLLFCGLCAFTFWLHRGVAVDFSLSSYLAPLRFWNPEQSPNLNDFILFPISVERTPIHAIVLGLLLASIVAVPIVVAILYRFRFALPFVAAIGVFAHMPWMSFTLLISCTLAVIRPWRITFRFVSALIGMLPVLIYLLLATRGPTDEFNAAASPAQKALLMAPWVLAILAACVMMAAILGIARFVNYRPGPIAPVIAVMFATPLVIFHAYVGVDELEYRVLEAEYGPHSARFLPVRDVTPEIQEMLREATSEPRDVREVLSGNVQPARQRLTNIFAREFLADRNAAFVACSNFIAAHPKSQYVPCALYLRGRALDTRLDTRPLLEGTRRELYADFPNVQSEETWAALLTGHPQSPLALAAGPRLAQIRLRLGNVDGAVAALDAMESARRTLLERLATSQPAAGRGLMGSGAPEDSLDYIEQPDLFQARRLRELIAANRDDPEYGNRPLTELFSLDPRRDLYLTQLLLVAERYPGALLHDNLIVLWSNGQADYKERAAALEGCIRAFPDGDAVAEAMFRLADLEIQTLAASDESVLLRGLDRMAEVARRFEGLCWGVRAAERLRLLEPRTASKTEAGERS